MTTFKVNKLEERMCRVSHTICKRFRWALFDFHYNDVIMSAMASQITEGSIICLTVCSGGDQRKHQGSASLAFVREIHRWPVDSPQKWPVTRKMFPFDDVIMAHVIVLNGPRPVMIKFGEYGIHGMFQYRWPPHAQRTSNALQWRHNESDGVSNHQPHDCLLNHFTRRRSRKTSKLRVTGLCVGNSPVNSPHKGSETRKMFPFDDVIMAILLSKEVL